MATFVTLFNLTEDGVKRIKDAPKRAKAAIKAAEDMGGRILSVYSTMGEYDYVAVAEWPNDEAAAAFALALGSKGMVKTTTMRAFTMDEYSGIIEKLS